MRLTTASYCVGAAFKAWMQLHGKTYQPQELDSRYEIFKNNTARVLQHNEEYAAGLQTFTLKCNKFCAMSNQEYRAKYLNLKPRKPEARELAAAFTVSGNGSVPDSWDWRSEGAVTKVKDQGSCGMHDFSCCLACL